MTGSDPSARPPDCGSDAAPYVLGALEPSEARAFLHHMQSCAVCRDEVAALVPTLEALLDWADSLVVTKPASPDTIAKMRSSGLAIIDVTRIAAPAGQGAPWL